jgi:hypothetical protein
MPIEFVQWDTRFPLHKVAHDYLISACAHSHLAILTAEQVIKSVTEGNGTIFIVIDNAEIIGCFTLSIRTNAADKYLELPLLAGMRLKAWRDDLVAFLFSVAGANKCTKFTMIGRKGFNRLFPELKLLTCVYGRNLT